MPVLPPMHSPRAALRDLAALWRRGEREQRYGLVLALLATAIILILFFADSKVNTKPAPTITYVESWSADRSDADIKADQAKDQAAKAAFEEQRRKDYQKLQNRLGIE